MKRNFKELVDVNELQELTDELFAASSIASAIVAIDGELLTGSGRQRICTDFHRQNPISAKDCKESDTKIREGLDEGKPFVMYRCPRGLVDASSPIIIAGEHVASVLAGQVFLKPPNKSTEQFFREQAKEFGFDEEDYINAFCEIPVFSEEEFRAAISFLSKLAQMIAKMGLTRLRELEAMEKRLTAREETEQARKNSEEYLRSVFEAADNVAFITTDLEGTDTRVLGFSPGAENIFGYAAEEIIDQKASILHLPGEAKRFPSMQKTLLDGSKGFSGETTLVRKSGERFSALFTLHPRFDSSEKLIGTLGVSIDITDLKQAELALQESKERYKLLYDNALAAMYTVSLDGKPVSINDVGLSMLGYSSREDFFKNFEATNHWASPDEEIHLLGLLKEKGEVYNFETQAKTTVGKTFWTASSLRINAKENTLDAMVIDITERRRAEDALRKSEEKYRLLADNATDVIWTMNMEQRITYLSPSIEKLRGFTPDEALKISMEDGLTSDSYKVVVATIREEIARDGEPEVAPDRSVTIELEQICKNGSTVWTEVTTSFLRDDNGSPIGFLGITRDITERKQAEEARLVSEKRMRSLIDQSPVSIQILDDSGNVIQANEAWEKLWGVPWEEFVKLEYNMLEDKQLVEIGLMKFLEKAYEGEVVTLPAAGYDAMTTSENGNKRWVRGSIYPIKDKSGKVVNIVLMHEDITDRRVAEEKLSSQKNFIDIAIDSLPGIFYLFTQEGKFLRWNRNFEIVSGYTADEINTMHPREFFPVEEQPLVEKRIREVFSKGESSVEANWLSKDGTKTFYFLTGTLVVVEGIPCQVGMGVDINNRVIAEEERGKLESQLRQAQKMESVGRLAGGVAHDFNNLLTGITGNISLAQMDMSTDDPIYKMLGEIDRIAERAADLTRQLLAFSRKQIIEPKVINLNDLIENMYRMLGRIIGEDVEIKTLPLKRLGRIKADPGQVEQIITNLAVNARDAMPDGGKLTIETVNVNLDEEYCKKHPYVEPGKYVMLAISDNGVGMVKETQSRIFDPFFTTKAEGQGTGLGLATAYGIVKQHGGHVEVYSEIGAGTTFKIYFPLVQSKAETITRTSPLSHLPRGTETVYIVEDESMVRNIATKILTRLGYKVVSADDGLHALAAANDKGIPIDLLLTDIVMPNMNGRELAEKLHKQYPEMKVLFTSGYTENVIVHHGVLEEGLNFIGKPYTPQGLAEKVRKVLDARAGSM
ncbi:MAG: PAS domain S-box protein [Proteobacteria bacterium]|nr:PAS domain S-box protein [Pseudomonadota bacterium]